ncbi:Acetolactate synthase large subunit [Corynebacterium pseudotuberculosis]|nr:Acetolactate synthase large subunit [Corynebacterium pseudotuberculosis]AIG08138.1 Acetolactate synthase large subunit [Corynebacterium pseudotuberculosis]AIG11730.1 Acetolactate synthase large subunit [Corynebacterium pseudotuberculosis]AKC73646.1 Hypothetical protein Cp226_0918 [Corynebacterium pseudotuberculosis]VTQ72741.1 acetolactate synthase large subunit [Corynebacterium pseudotuberculosis]
MVASTKITNLASSALPSPSAMAKRSEAQGPERMTGAEAIVRSLEALGTDIVLVYQVERFFLFMMRCIPLGS